MKQVPLFTILLALCCASAIEAAPVAITPGFSDYQPSVIRTQEGVRLLVFERLDGSAWGNLWITRSSDGGETWSAPQPIIATSANERHPALLELAPSRSPSDLDGRGENSAARGRIIDDAPACSGAAGQEAAEIPHRADGSAARPCQVRQAPGYALFYLKGTGSTASYRIMRATSGDGLTFTEQGALNLGWASGGEINPHVIRHADGTLTMSYQRLGAGSYIARSFDGGVSWDTLRTPIATGSQLPRITYRESDGLYLASYQVGSTALSMHIKTTTNPYDWSTIPQDFASNGNHHDSLPVVMPDGAFAVFWIAANGSQFDLRVRRSLDGFAWQPTRVITSTPTEDDVQPHPLVGDSAVMLELYWGRAAPVGQNNFRIVRDAAVAVMDDVLFADGFE
ncbi:MAG TPA: sialidase family protein [Dokdonella sp.]|uniref:sialidase family protein n=1 Tax=Dokdonella sp. TaxID=2291710 RepID=UPI0025BF4819|nr:sialidase family protein [Dokdonella sp.]MBX3691491.1 exo-alpha-sialidase [Dokdonella sp.]MCW5567849.1 exo-alpha-sialidase [Dokdonella sp.]HNR91043.1 sialidase family protein [Dokdonella sp.]